jgi:hypothetical protein
VSVCVCVCVCMRGCERVKKNEYIEERGEEKRRKNERETSRENREKERKAQMYIGIVERKACGILHVTRKVKVVVDAPLSSGANTTMRAGQR